MRVVFFGSSEYCLPVVKCLADKFEISAIITKPDRKLGSGHPELDSGSITRSRNKFGMTPQIFTPSDKSKLSELKNEIRKLNPDLAVVSDYGLIIPVDIFEIPKYKTLNIHFSKLPDLRGSSPVQYTILRGDKTAWITIQILDAGLDTGDILYQKEVILDGFETTNSLYKKLFNKAAMDLPNIISKYVRNELKPIKQDNEKATYTKLLTREDGFISADLLFGVILRSDDESKWKVPFEILKTQGILRLTPQDDIKDLYYLAIFIERAIRAFTPWPGVWTEIQIPKLIKHLEGGRMDSFQVEKLNKRYSKRLKILKAHLEKISAKPIQLNYVLRYTDVVSNLHIPVRLVIDKVQLEGKKPVSWKQFLEGYPNIIISDNKSGKIPI